MPDSAHLHVDAIDPELKPGAHNAVRTCLSIEPGEKVVLIADEPTAEIAAAILSEIVEVGAEVSTFLLEEQGDRPIGVLPQAIVRALRRATASLLIVRPEPGELQARMTVADMALEHGVRHAHMPGVEHRMMVTGMRADYRKVARLQERLLERVLAESVVSVRTPAGTDLEVTFTPDHKWVRCDGLIQPGVWQNLPTGQLFTTPDNVEGVFVGDGAIGEWFGVRYPDLEQYPLKVEVSGGRAVAADSPNAALARQFLLYVRSNPSGDRVGEFSIGTNLALTSFLGNALQDENVPGSHLAFGGAAILASTGAKWTARTHVPLIARNCDIDIDGVPIMRGGVFVDDVLEDS